MAGALLADALVGYPEAVYRRAGHPVTWVGGGLAWLDRRLNDPPVAGQRGRAVGAAALAVLLTVTGAAAWLVQTLLLRGMPRGAGHAAALAVLAIMASTLIAQRSLWQHVRAVESGLRAGLDTGRAAVSHIVGRNPASLDEAGVGRAAIESLAENFSDGVVAPALWGVLLGLPGIVLYKTINTADSMIGHRTPRHLAFGWASARLDDLVNVPAARLSALLLVLAACLSGGDAKGAVHALGRDAHRHRSPNAGWPEAAMAGALGLRLAGPRVYGTVRVEDGWMGHGRAAVTPDDIDAALRLYRLACGIGWAMVLVALGLATVF